MHCFVELVFKSNVNDFISFYIFVYVVVHNDNTIPPNKISKNNVVGYIVQTNNFNILLYKIKLNKRQWKIGICGYFSLDNLVHKP